jgi:hypothetical protein
MGVLALLVIAGFLLSRRRTRHLATRQSPRSETV